MQPPRPSATRSSLLRLRRNRNFQDGTKSPSPLKSPLRRSANGTSTAAVTASSTLAPTALTSSTPTPPRQSFVYGPLTTTSVTTIIREESRRDQHEGISEKREAPISSVQHDVSNSGSRGCALRPGSRVASSWSTAASPQRHATPTNEELRELRQTRSLFLCGRGLLSLRHIQHLPEMLSLRFLSVHMNAIKSLEAGCLQTLRHLVELDLSANELQELPLGCWAGLDRLERLNLSSNVLTQLEANAFRGLNSLQWLSLGYNNLHDIAGLSSVPASAPLSYVDLCANRINAVEEVMRSLNPHRAHLQELRLASPSPKAAPNTATATVAAPFPLLNELSALEGTTSSYWQVQENPLCVNNADSAVPVCSDGASAVVAAPPPYVQKLLSFFPHLLVVNGTSYGVDPLEMLTLSYPDDVPQIQDSKQDELQNEATSTKCGTFASNQEERTKEVNLSDTSAEFARLLSQPLPCLPSSSTPTSSSHASSSRATSHTTQHRRCRRSSERRQYRRKHNHSDHLRTRSQRRRTRSNSQKRLHTTASEEHQEVTCERVKTVNSRSTKNTGSGSSSFSLNVPPKIPSVHLSRRRLSAPTPRRAPLRRRRSASTATSLLSHDSSATASPSIVLPPEHHSQQQGIINAADASSHARQLNYDGEGPQREKSATSDAVRRPSSTQTWVPATSASVPVEEGHRGLSQGTPTPRDAPDNRARLGSVSQDAGTAAGAAKRSSRQSAPGLSPSGITDASDRTSSPPSRGDLARRWDSVPTNDCGGDALSVDMSGSESDVSSPENDLAAGKRNGASKPSTEKRDNGDVSEAQRDAAYAPAPRDSRAPRGTPSPYPVVSSTSRVTLQLKPKRISRGICTDLITTRAKNTEDNSFTRDDITAAVADVQREMQVRLEQLQEQLDLRSTTVADLRHHLDLTRSQYVAAQREAQQQQQQLRSQVAALKDELARRSEEASILQRKQHAQLNRAVDSVRLEWSRRLEACEQHCAAVKAEESGRWEAQVAHLQEDVAQLQQTCTVKATQLETVQRMVAAMEGEMDGLRCRAVIQRQHTLTQAQLVLAEADARRALQAAAAEARVEGVRAFFQFKSQVEVKALQAAWHELQSLTNDMERQKATYAAQAKEYEAALQHAAREVEQLHEQQQLQQRQLEGAIVQNTKLSALSTDAERDPDYPDSVSASKPTPTPTPTLTPQLPTCTALVVVDAIKPPAVHAPSTSVFNSSDSAVSTYWLGVCARTEEQLRKMEAALQVATDTQQSLASENTRLLRRVASLEADQANATEAKKTLELVAAQEKENLLRTLHTLRADMERKDGALDALEGEARAKLHEKRQRIAELEAEVDTLTAQHTRATELNVSYRTQLEAAQRSAAELKSELEGERRRCSMAVQEQTAQLPEQERKLRELSELLAARTAQAQQHELEKKALVHALTTAREQLIRLQKSNTFLTNAHAETKEQLMRQQMELDATRQQLRDTQEATRAKQQATREALSRLINADAL